MGRGKKIIKCLKKHLRFRRKPFRKWTKKRKTKRPSSSRSLHSLDQCHDDISGRSTAVDDYSPHPHQKEWPWDEISVGTYIDNPGHSLEGSISTDNISIGEFIELLEDILSGPSQDITVAPFLPPVKEAYESEPALCHITTTKMGSMAFSVAEAGPKTPLPACLSARPPGRAGQMSGHDLTEKMKVSHLRKQSIINEIRQRCRQKFQQVKVAQARKKNVHCRPLLHGTSLLSELPSTPDIFTMPPTRGGVAFQIVHRPLCISSTKTDVHGAEESEPACNPVTSQSQAVSSTSEEDPAESASVQVSGRTGRVHKSTTLIWLYITGADYQQDPTAEVPVHATCVRS